MSARVILNLGVFIILWLKPSSLRLFVVNMILLVIQEVLSIEMNMISNQAEGRCWDITRAKRLIDSQINETESFWNAKYFTLHLVFIIVLEWKQSMLWYASGQQPCLVCWWMVGKKCKDFKLHIIHRLERSRSMTWNIFCDLKYFPWCHVLQGGVDVDNLHCRWFLCCLSMSVTRSGAEINAIQLIGGREEMIHRSILHFRVMLQIQ